jgi:hypothetical protein
MFHKRIERYERWEQVCFSSVAILPQQQQNGSVYSLSGIHGKGIRVVV